MNKHTVNIVRTINAAKITSKLNIRIRRSYACIQLAKGFALDIPAGCALGAEVAASFVEQVVAEGFTGS